MDVNFMQPSTGADPSQFSQQRALAQMLMQRGMPQQGQAAGASNPMGSLMPLAGGAMQLWGQNMQQDANKAATALNGGVATVGQAPAAFSRFGNMLSGLVGG
jgi:hypothetical protein